MCDSVVHREDFLLLSTCVFQMLVSNVALILFHMFLILSAPIAVAFFHCCIMPPKSKAVDAKAKAAQAARRDSKTRLLEKSNCIDEAEGTGLKTSAKKQKTELTIEQDTLKACKDNFKGYSDFQLRHILNKDNVSVYDQVFQRKTEKILDPKSHAGNKSMLI